MAWTCRIVLYVGIVASIASQAVAQPRLRAESGVLDARRWNFEEDRLPLQGYWTLFEDQLLTPEGIASMRGRDQFFPSLWNNLRTDGRGSGYATYALKILLPDTVTTLAVEIPQLYSSCRLWANSKEIASIGTVGKSKEETTPQWIYKTATFHIEQGDTLQLVLQLANFHHYKGGMKDPILLGAPTRVDSHKGLALNINFVETCVLIVLGVVFLVLHTFKKKTVVLYFSLLCLTWSVRVLFSNLYPVTALYPDFDWALLVKIEYLSLYAGIIWAVLFLHRLFQNLSNHIIVYTVVVLNVFFVLFTLFTPVVVFTQWVSLYLAVAGVAVVYGGVLVIRAVLSEHAGAGFLVGSILLGVIVFGYDIVAYNAAFSYNQILLSCGYIGMFLLTAMALLFHLGIIKGEHTTVLTYDDLFKKDRK